MSRERRKNLFTEVPLPKVKRNVFDLSHEVKLSGKFGYLYPVLCLDVLPGDVISDEMNLFMRFAPMLAPVMHRVDATVHCFYVPNRLTVGQQLWEKFITGGQDGMEEPVLPFITPRGIVTVESQTELLDPGSLWDYLGLPVGDGSLNPADPGLWSQEQISVIPFRACAKIWNDYYRDPNLDDEMELDLDVEGDVSADTVASGILQISNYRRMWEKDYFTSCLPWPQRGPDVLVPFEVSGEGEVDYLPTSILKLTGGGNPGGTWPVTARPADNNLHFDDNISGYPTGRIENIDTVLFDAQNGSTTINDLRRAFAVQKWLENNARGGARYTEQILGHFGVQVPDYRLQRAEYLGGMRSPVQISEVLSTAETQDVPVGDMYGHGLSVGTSRGWRYHCQEHGYVIAFLSVVPRTAYQQGIHRHWTRKNKFEFAFPELANLGEQAVLSKELYYSFASADDDDNNTEFGYIPRYAEYKYMVDRVAGDFRTSLDFWHLGRIFTQRPELDSAFTSMLENSGYDDTYRRIFAVTDGTDYLWIQLYHRLIARRPLPYFGVPKLIA